MVVTLVWTCNSRQDSGERCPLCGWETLVQIQAVATTVQDLLNKAALKRTDPYALINSRDQDDLIEEIKASPALPTNLWVAQREIFVEERAREQYLHGGGLNGTTSGTSARGENRDDCPRLATVRSASQRTAAESGWFLVLAMGYTGRGIRHLTAAGVHGQVATRLPGVAWERMFGRN